ncbi:MAG: Undecaprenyl-phosphate 4-deoxy-4-formamido-L-arabinose transferase [candidate division WS6 bacterium OLB20]|uniref:Undecaprenyl-phosphate 4-deoxy-4-formamido-L-arabinose transferase n=1 Tax=candidate division WS6 bacterium OLB20 TaxID=1617426 RepID=A0A136LVW9_9BACT|nr:MAG: Undecaprenyl-phosphate 4-deoxy-4-formamido-L-arabinose transferase [candidate division WS6 bacterium OLB20]
MTKPKILVFIPMYNCEKQIPRVLAQIDERVAPFVAEVIVVNNRSTDNSEQTVKDLFAAGKLPVKGTLLRNDQNYNLGGSHKVAFDYAIKNGFDYVIVLHGDDQADIHDLLPYLQDKTYEKYDCLLGSRFMKGSRLKGYSALRTLGNLVYNVLFSAATRRRVKDLGSGLNMYNTAMLQSRFYVNFSDRLTFNYFMIFANAYYGFQAKFFPISWREEDQVSNVKLFSQARDMLLMVVRFVLRPKTFINADHRLDKDFAYTSTIVATTT